MTPLVIVHNGTTGVCVVLGMETVRCTLIVLKPFHLVQLGAGKREEKEDRRGKEMRGGRKS